MRGAGTEAGRPSWSGALCRPTAEERRRGPRTVGAQGLLSVLPARERWVFSAGIILGTPHFPVGLKLGSPFRTTSLVSPVQLPDTSASERGARNLSVCGSLV